MCVVQVSLTLSGEAIKRVSFAFFLMDWEGGGAVVAAAAHCYYAGLVCRAMVVGGCSLLRCIQVYWVV